MDNRVLIAIAVGVGAMILFWVWDRWVIPWQARRHVRVLLRNYQSGKRAAPRKSKYAIAFDKQGFIVRAAGQPEPLRKMSWSDIKRVTAFKRDWLTIDCICLAIGAPDETVTELDEDLDGWEEFVTALPNYLPGCRPWSKWFSEVAFPAFATNLTEVFNREGVTTT